MVQDTRTLRSLIVKPGAYTCIVVSVLAWLLAWQLPSDCMALCLFVWLLPHRRVQSNALIAGTATDMFAGVIKPLSS